MHVGSRQIVAFFCGLFNSNNSKFETEGFTIMDANTPNLNSRHFRRNYWQPTAFVFFALSPMQWNCQNLSQKQDLRHPSLPQIEKPKRCNEAVFNMFPFYIMLQATRLLQSSDFEDTKNPDIFWNRADAQSKCSFMSGNSTGDCKCAQHKQAEPFAFRRVIRPGQSQGDGFKAWLW